MRSLKANLLPRLCPRTMCANSCESTIASLAMVLSHELAHIVLGHNLGSKFAFNDRMLFTDESTYQNFGFRHVPEEEAAADKKAIEMLKNSPYSQKLDTAGFLFKQLTSVRPAHFRLPPCHLRNNV